MRRFCLIALLLLVTGMANATTYYVDPSGGSDGAAGTSFGAAWLTTQHALDTVAAVDEVRLCQTATETTAVQIDADGTSGTDTSPILFISYNSDGTVQSDGYTIQASAAMTALLDISTVKDYRWVGVLFDANSNATSALRLSTSTVEETVFDACEFFNAIANGVLQNTTVENTYSTCIFRDNGASGMASEAAGRGACVIFGGSAHDNTSYGLIVEDSVDINNFLAYRNTNNAGIMVDARNEFATLVNVTSFDNGGDGLAFLLQPRVSIVNCTMSSNGGYGLSLDAAEDHQFVDYNHYYNNTIGETDVPSGTPGRFNQTGDPLFTNTGAGTEDFTPLTTSPLIRNGLNNSDIGAVAHADGGGGGGTAYRPRMRTYGN